jgi:hypothetical protein
MTDNEDGDSFMKTHSLPPTATEGGGKGLRSLEYSVGSLTGRDKLGARYQVNGFRVTDLHKWAGGVGWGKRSLGFHGGSPPGRGAELSPYIGRLIKLL